MSPDNFDMYKAIETEVENRIMERLQPVFKDMQSAYTEQGKAIKALSEDIKPLVEMFKNVNSWSSITVSILKGLALIGVAIGGLYVVIEFFKKLGSK